MNLCLKIVHGHRRMLLSVMEHTFDGKPKTILQGKEIGGALPYWSLTLLT